MAEREASIEREGTRRAKARGWYEFKIRFANRRGLPDRFYGKNGRAVFVEWKRPGERPSRQQEKRHDELRAAGFDVHWFDNLEDADAVLA